MDPNEITLNTLNKMFEYEKQARFIDDENSSDQLKNIAKSYLKLYLKQQEVVASIGLKSA